MKTSVKHFGLAVGPSPGNMSQNDPKTTALVRQPRTAVFFAKARTLVRQPRTAVFFAKIAETRQFSKC